MQRKLTVAVLFVLLVAMGVVLYLNIGSSRTFTIAPPVVGKAAPAGLATEAAALKQSVSTTTVSSLTTLATQAELTKPRYTGEDALGRHFEVTGQKATQAGSTVSGTYTLTGVAARWQDPSQTEPFLLTATQGTYTPANKMLLLTGEVSSTALNVTLTAPQIRMDMTNRTLVAGGAGGVVAQGVVGGWQCRIAAPSLQVGSITRTLTFTGGVHTVLVPQPK